MTERLALFFDVDNLEIEALKRGIPFQIGLIVDRIREEGVLAFARAYADWSNSRYALRDFDRFGFELAELPRQFRGKNTADIQIAVDALELALAPNAPDTTVLVSGDRDFVPLVQKLKRYGKRVIGIGISGASSHVLQSVCDSFVFYDDLVPVEETDEDNGDGPRELDLSDVYALMLRAVTALDRRQVPISGTAVGFMMRQLEPTFAPDRYGVTLRQLAIAAQDRGFVRVVDIDGTEFRLESARELSSLQRADWAEESNVLRFNTADDALASYRLMLAQKRVPLIPWPQRKALIKHLWSRLAIAPEGTSFAEMAHLLATYCDERDLNVPTQAIQKLIYTLNIGACFSMDRKVGRYSANPHMTLDRFFAAVDDSETVVDVANQVYLKGLLRSDPQTPFIPDAVALLLFDESNEGALENARRLIGFIETERRGPPSFESRPLRRRTAWPAPRAIPSEPEADYELLRRAVAELTSNGRKAVGAAVKPLMESLDPSFDLSRHGCTFLQFAQRAAAAKAVRIVGPHGNDFVLDLP